MLRPDRTSAVLRCANVDGSAIVTDLREMHLDDVVRASAPSVGPFDGDDAVAGDEIVEAEVVHLVGIQTVEIDVIQRGPAAVVLLDERKRRARHLIRRCPEAAGDAAYKRGLSRAEIAEQKDDVAGLQRGAELFAGCCGLGLAGRRGLHGCQQRVALAVRATGVVCVNARPVRVTPPATRV